MFCDVRHTCIFRSLSCSSATFCCSTSVCSSANVEFMFFTIASYTPLMSERLIFGLLCQQMMKSQQPCWQTRRKVSAKQTNQQNKSVMLYTWHTSYETADFVLKMDFKCFSYIRVFSLCFSWYGPTWIDANKFLRSFVSLTVTAAGWYLNLCDNLVHFLLQNGNSVQCWVSTFLQLPS